VSGGVARKEHAEFSNNIDLIDVLPPGLYEATFERKATDTANPDLTSGDWVMRCEQRTLDDIRALGGNDPADDRCFAAAARVSEMNLALYRTYAQPLVRALANPQLAEWMRKLHPLRITYEVFSDANPMMALLKPTANWVREHRSQPAADNPLIAWQENLSKQIVTSLDAWRDACDALAERSFFGIYSSPALQAAVGVDPTSTQPLRRPAKNPMHQELLRKRVAELKSRIPTGSMLEAIVRALLYVGMGRRAVDERGFEIVRRIRQEHEQSLPLSDFKALVREQFYMLLIDQEAALSAIPAMLPNDRTIRQQALDLIKRVLSARGLFDAEDEARLARIVQLFDLTENAPDAGNVVALSPPRTEVQTKAS
jgi:hypothetical protein